jgi:hypothetical protein
MPKSLPVDMTHDRPRRMTDRAADDLDIASFHARRSVRTAPCIVGVIESFDRPDAALSTTAMRRCDV